MDEIFIQFRKKFIKEALSLIKNLEKSLMQLEDNSKDKEAIEKVFRFAHTLKGISGMYGFKKIAEYTHELETLFDCIQNETLSVNTEIIDLTLQSADHIKNLLFDFDFAKPENQSKQINLLEKLKQLDYIVNKEPENVTAIKKDHEKKTRSWYIYFVADEQLIHRGVNILYLFHDLAEIGKFEIFKHHPGIVSETENDSIDEWGIFLTTEETKDTIKDIFIFVEDNYKLYKLSDENLFDEKPEVEIPKPDTESLPFQIEDLQQLKQTELIEIINRSFEEKTQKDVKEPQSENKSESSISDRILTQSINVDTAKLDTLMHLVSDLVTSNEQLKLSFKNSDMNQMGMVVEKMEKLTKQFRNNTFSLRLIPVQENIFRFQRLIRDLSHKLKKQIKFEIEGGETELDKNILDKLTEPLMHLVRNSIDHGIELPEDRVLAGKSETGTIKFKTQHSGNHVIISIIDDGCGIDEQKIIEKALEKGVITVDKKLSQQEIFDIIFLPGFSTVESLTEISGRGVGMDVVKKKIMALQGEIKILSEKGKGTQFIIKLQQTVSIIDTMLFQINDMYFTVPLTDIEECNIISKSVLESKKYTGTVPFHNKLIPYVDLYELYNLEEVNTNKFNLLVINKQESRFAIAAHNIIGEHQAVLKSIGKLVKKQENIAGVSILGDGNLAFMLDITALQQVIKKNRN
jgi:two-component system chemotaxis sensor kinase CheA